MGQFLICLPHSGEAWDFSARLPSPLSLPQRVLPQAIKLLRGRCGVAIQEHIVPPFLLHVIWPLLFQCYPVQQGQREQIPLLALLLLSLQ